MRCENETCWPCWKILRNENSMARPFRDFPTRHVRHRRVSTQIGKSTILQVCWPSGNFKSLWKRAIEIVSFPIKIAWWISSSLCNNLPGSRFPLQSLDVPKSSHPHINRLLNYSFPVYYHDTFPYKLYKNMGDVQTGNLHGFSFPIFVDSSP